MANGWDSVIWIAIGAIGAIGVVAAGRAEAALGWSVLAGGFFVLAAVWGFVDGRDVFGLMAVDTTDNISHAIVGAAGLIAAMAPDSARHARESGGVGRGHPTHA
jgi:hypothetical protein